MQYNNNDTEGSDDSDEEEEVQQNWPTKKGRKKSVHAQNTDYSKKSVDSDRVNLALKMAVASRQNQKRLGNSGRTETDY